MAARKRPRKSMVPGLRKIASLACAELEMGEESDWVNSAAKLGELQSTEDALQYLYELCDWLERAR